MAPSSVTLESSTLSGNLVASNTQAADLYVRSNDGSTQTITLHNTILSATAGNPAGTPNAATSGAGATITSLGHNISSDGSSHLTGPGDLPNTNALLGTFGFHGGATPTIPTLVNSPAINNGDPGGGAPTFDQRGATRGTAKGLGPEANAGALPDIGAFEQSSLYVVTSSDATTTPQAYDNSVVGTLRGGVEWANGSRNVLVPTTTSNVIRFDTSGNFATPQTITLSLAGLTLSNTSVPESVIGSGVTISGAKRISLFQVNSSVTGTISDLTVTDGYTAFSMGGGGILNYGTLTISNLFMSQNHAPGGGGGISNAMSGILTITNSTISGNLATVGGGLYNQGNVVIQDTTIVGNSAEFGAAMYLSIGIVTIEDSTITANLNAPAIKTYTNLILNNTTLALNPDGGLQIGQGGMVTVRNTILAGNNGFDISGTIVSLGSNLIQNPAGGSGFVSSDLLNVDPRLLPLARNGGLTATLGLGFSLPGDPSFPNNPAVDAGDPTSAPLPTDQRGFTRVINGIVDIGAFEDQLVLAAPTSPQTAVEGNSQSFNVGSFTDAAPGVSIWSATIIWGDGSPNTPLTLPSQGPIAKQAHSYKEEGTYTATVQVSDGVGDAGQKAFTVNVSDPNVSAYGGFILSTSENSAFWNQPVATFIDPAGPEALDNYSASINWGDDSGAMPGTIVQTGTTFYILGSHSCPEEGNYTITVTINHENTTPQTVTSSSTVSDPSVVATGSFPFTAVEGALSATQTVATFTDPAGPSMLSAYSASIDWGDGTPATSGSISQPAGGTTFTVAGSHSYSEEGAYTLTVTVNHETSVAQTVTDSVAVSEVNVVAMGGFSFTASKGTASASQTVATFTDPAGPEATASYTTSINWGDGNTTAGSVTLNQSTFTVSGSHTYAAAGNYTITVTIAHEVSPPVKVTDPLTVSGTGVSAKAVNVTPTAGAPFTGAVATFTDPAGSDPTVIYTASIAWGDNRPPIAGTITVSNGVFTVSGGYTYAAAGSYSLTTTIYRQGVPTTIQGNATVASLGQFVPAGMVKPISFWEGLQGQQLLRRFGLTAKGQSLGQWLASTFPNLYGGQNGAANLSPFSNAQIGSYYQSLFLVSKGTGLDAEVLATALEVFATTTSLGGTVGQSFGYVVTDNGLGAYSWNVGASGQAFGVPNLTVLNVFQLLQAANNSAVSGEPWATNSMLRNESLSVFRLLNGDG
ncbi:MAG TPA: choice-of-anchor Q domain-containing protein [Gemmataceae bacterium]|nr:choice-of-anchor Q domain-containing protein [Gemmataceae bacterium]